jgi:hypothetical protein
LFGGVRVFIFCFVCLRPVSCVPNVTSISLYCPFLIIPSVYVTVYLNIFYCSLLIANGYDKCFFLIFETSSPAICFLIIFLVPSFAVFIYEYKYDLFDLFCLALFLISVNQLWLALLII